MKSKFLRMIAMILILASLLSMVSVFSFAAETDDAPADEETGEGEENDALAAIKEKYEHFSLLFQRNFEEGWEIKNGFTWTDRGSFIDVDYETTFDYNYNYFFRFTVGSKDNSYLELDFKNGNKVGSVLEFDIMSDDYCNIKGLMHFGTLGTPSSNRQNPGLLSIIDGKAYLFDDAAGGAVYGDADKDGNPDSARNPGYSPFDITEEWMHVAVVLDYTYGDVYDDETGELISEDKNNFLCSIYYGPRDVYEQTGELQLYDSRVLCGKESGGGEGISLMRIGTSGEPEENFDTSVCFDNIVAYNGANEYGLATPEMGYGLNVDETMAKTVEILGGGSSAGAGDYLNEAIAMKVGVDYARANKKRVPLFTNEDGEAYGAPVIIDEVVYVPLTPILEALDYPYYIHKDGNFVDISTGESSSYISVGKDSATVNGARTMLNTAPAIITDEGGNEFIAVDLRDIDIIIPGRYHDYDELGLIIIAQKENLIDRNVNLEAMTSIMKDFVFDYVSSEEVYQDVKDYTNNFDHPYLWTNQEKFDELYAIYNAVEGDDNYDPEYQSYLERLVSNAEWYYTRYAKYDSDTGYDEYVGIMSEQELVERYGVSSYVNSYSLLHPYYEPTFFEINGETVQVWGAASGYDPEGGRLNASGLRNNNLMYMAAGWVLTHDIKYLLCAYDIALKMGEWAHWGPGHFLNCADASAPFAIFYDWCYDGIVALNNGTGDLDGDGVADIDMSQVKQVSSYYDVKKLEDILYEKGVYEGYLASNGVLTQYVSPIVGTGGSYYHDRVNNWNAVCSSGMIIASLAVLDSADSVVANNASWLISDNIEHLARYGMQQYAPDGSYIEGPGYWNYGTNNFFELCMALENATGQTYNLMNCWGIDTTCYFAMHTESSDFRTFNFHDGSMGSQATEFFYYVGNYFNDSNLIGVRTAQIKNGKGFTIYDMLYYPGTMDQEGAQLELDYYSKNLDLYTARSSWDAGATFIGMMGGENHVTHGQLDAGSFVYHNMGTVWFIDLGTENYNCEGFWPDATRFRYYVMKPEGNNTVALASNPEVTPYGQVLDSAAPSTGFGANEYGSYITFDMTATLGGLATTWNRGMLLTNDRKTTVIQDDVVLNGAQTMYWFGHYSNNYVDEVEISSDGRKAYMSYTDSDDKVHMLRATIVSDKASLKFEIWDAYTFLHTAEGNAAEAIPENPQYTYPPEFALTNGLRVGENDRSQYSKLVVKSVNAISFKMAVVLEEIDPATKGNNYETKTAYEWVNMSDWEPVKDTNIKVEENKTETRGNAKLSEIASNVARAKQHVDTGTAFTDNFDSFYRSLTDVYYVIRSFMGEGDLLSRYEAQCALFDEYNLSYKAFSQGITGNLEVRDSILNSVFGF